MTAESFDRDACDPFLQVTLVHGTWGRGFFPDRFRTERSPPRWFEAHSDFTSRLREKLSDQGVSCQIRAFLWSGANSVSARDLAARELATLIAQDSVESHRLIIGHSHGGNVALRGLSYLDDDPRRRSMVVTLATLFLDVVPRQTGKSEEAFIQLTCLAAPLLLGILVFACLL